MQLSSGGIDGNALPDPLFRDSKGRVREAPVMPAPVADTHAHLSMLDDPSWALACCAVHHVDFVVAMVDPAEDVLTYGRLDSWREGARALLDAWDAAGWRAADGRMLAEVDVPRVRIGIGVHPHNAKLYTEACARCLVEHAADPRTSFIGEIGLDYHYDLSPRDLQQEVFAQQVLLAQELGMPIALHLREAHDDALEVLARTGVPEAGCVVHCFNLDADALMPWLDLGCHIALGGPLTFRKSGSLREAACLVPVERLCTETDSPYMTPEPVRGTECGPAHTVFTAQRLCDVYLEAHPEIADAGTLLQQLYDNASAFFDRPACSWQGDDARRAELMARAQGCISEEDSRRLCAELFLEER